MIRRASLAAALMLAMVVMPAVAATPGWYKQIGARVQQAEKGEGQLMRCPQLSGGRIVGNVCARAQAKKIGLAMSGLMSLAGGYATQGVCAKQLKAMQRDATSGMTTALTFAAAAPAGTAANINARTGVVNAVTAVIKRQTAIAYCLAARP